MSDLIVPAQPPAGLQSHTELPTWTPVQEDVAGRTTLTPGCTLELDFMGRTVGAMADARQECGVSESAC